MEYIFNKKAYESLPKDIQQIIDAVCMESEAWTLAQFDSQNGTALQELITKHHVKLIKFPDEVLNGLRKLADEVVEEGASKYPLAKKAADEIVGTWGTVSEKAYYDIIQKKYPLQV